jgi:hypothetical protein
LTSPKLALVGSAFGAPKRSRNNTTWTRRRKGLLVHTYRYLWGSARGNHSSLANRPAFTAAHGAAMILHSTCAAVNHPDREVLPILSEA